MDKNVNVKERIKILERAAKKGDLYAAYPQKKKKEKVTKVSNRGLYDITLGNFQFHMYNLICQINGIDVGVYMYVDNSHTILNGNMKIDKKFKNLSLLDWKTPKGIDTLTFRGRFATLLLYRMVRNAHKIVKRIYREYDEDSKRYRAYNTFLDEVVYQTSLFVATFLSSNLDYWDPLRSLLTLLLIAENNDVDAIDKLTGTRELLLTAVKHPTKYNDGIIMNNITKSAYALATGSTNVKHTPKYDESLRRKDQHRMANQIGTLGLAILKYRKKHEQLPLLYDIFQEANPEIWSRFTIVNDAIELILATKSIVMLELLMGDQNIKRYIDLFI